MTITPLDNSSHVSATCIAGMHRSGTSMVAAVLNKCGLYLGPESQFRRREDDHSLTYWENDKFVRLNDSILGIFGGTSYDPPVFPHNWTKTERVASMRRAASEILNSFVGHEPWGWKDPRNSLTFAFWSELIVDVKVVICLRHPLEVAESLRTRVTKAFEREWPLLSASPYGLAFWKLYDGIGARLGGRSRVFPSYDDCMNLWVTYNRQILASTTVNQRLITHYDALLDEPRREIQRLLRFLNLPVNSDVLNDAFSIVCTNLRHHQAARTNRFKLPECVDQLYRQMCCEAQFP